MPAQTSQNLDELVRLLNAATDNKMLQWSKAAEEDTFRAQLGLGMVRISRGAAGSGYILSLLDDEGILLDEYQPAAGGELSAVETLYKKIRHQALNLEWKLKGVFDQLKTLAGESSSASR
jgi:hypothetical protein